MTGAERVFELLETDEADAPRARRARCQRPARRPAATCAFELDHVTSSTSRASRCCTT